MPTVKGSKAGERVVGGRSLSELLLEETRGE